MCWCQALFIVQPTHTHSGQVLSHTANDNSKPGPGDTRVSSSQGGHPPAVPNDAVDEARVIVQKLEADVEDLRPLGIAVFQCKQDNEAVPEAVQKKLAAVGIYDSTNLDTVLAKLQAQLEKAVSIHEEAMKQHTFEMQKAAQVPQVCYVRACVRACVCVAAAAVT